MKSPERDRLASVRRRGLPLALGIFLAAGCGERDCPAGETSGESAPEAAPGATAPSGAAVSGGAREAGGTPTHAEMRNVDLRIAEGVTLHVQHLVGQAVSAVPGQPVVLDDKTSYVIHVQSGEASIGYGDLSRVMNEYTFAFEGAPVKDLEIKREEDPGEENEIQLKGQLRKVLGVPFEIEGRPEATPEGLIRIRTTSIQGPLGIKAGGLMKVLGLEPKDLLGNLEKRGLRVDGNDLILDMSRALPPPRVAGRVTAVRVEQKGLALWFGAPGPPAAATSDTANYLWFRKGTIRIGKMTQRDAELRIVDADPRDPLDFYGDRMTEQLVAGYAKLGASGGLTMFVPDYGDMR